jgi:hypothetical protein
MNLSYDRLRDDGDDGDDNNNNGDCDEYGPSVVSKLIRNNRKMITISDCQLSHVRPTACLH